MATRLELAVQKLRRLKEREVYMVDRMHGHTKLTNGQPMNDKRNGAQWFRQMEKLESSYGTLVQEIRKQEERIERLQIREERREKGLNRNGSGMRLTIDNLPNIKKVVANYYEGKAGYTKATIKKYERAIERLESTQREVETTIGQKEQALIDSQQVIQWAKKPNVFFINGLRKVAFELVNGEFVLSKRYYPKTEKDKAYALSLIQ